MAHYPFLIVGGGMAASKAIVGIRQLDTQSKIGLFGEEKHKPYRRPPLTKKLWQGKPIDSIWRKLDFPGIEFNLDCRISSIDPANRTVVDEQGQKHTYEKLLLATGGKPRTLPTGGDDVLYFRTLDDYLQLREDADQGKSFAVIGGGFIGSEVAAALGANGNPVTMIFPDTGIGARIYPPDVSQYLNEYFRQKGIEVLTEDTVEGIYPVNGQMVVKTKNGLDLHVDRVVAGIGINPNTELAETAGLKIDRGIVVNQVLQTSHPDIYAAGDVATFTHPITGKPTRVEHEDNADTMGKIAGHNMAASLSGTEPQIPYNHQPYFYSDLFDIGYEAVGSLDSRLEIFTDWQEPYKQGVLYYLEDGRVRGVLLWNVWDQVNAARELIAQSAVGEKMTFEDLKGRLPA